jgi:methionine--tRNA ligase beta chain
MIALDDFEHMDLRIGEIVGANGVRGSSRLLRVDVDLGAERRVLVAKLAEHYRPDALIGLKVVVLANLAPAVIRGVESQGMLLGAGCEGMTPALLTVNRAVPNCTAVQRALP